ncbi:MAG: hypothetical protein DRG30_06155 [Epsilonproteobacteria bacterium]|nr:MAG: hypothetical protein DRG30_06155 [Campylobacterota bacterium]
MATSEFRSPTFARAKVSDKFFKRLRKNALSIANDISKKTADDMVFTLRIRGHLKGSGVSGARYPKWDGSNGKPSKESYKHWGVKQYKNGEYWIYNDAKSDDSWKYNYPYALMYGKGWSDRVKDAAPSKRLTGSGDAVFSTQMPEGIRPMVKLKREQMITDIKAAFKKGLHR